MTGPVFTHRPTGTFRDNARWLGDALVIDLDLRDGDQRLRVLCYVAEEVLEDATASTEPLTEATALAAYEELKDRIRRGFDRKLMAGDFQRRRQEHYWELWLTAESELPA